ncbi:hypothetical protein O3E_01205 [Candidatus Portiera aleyrodidarum MED (Bemisia tabaci)]|uniref:Uncharacterized protein n=1 Tax=Candidatus Portiera aleyrodidarum MED (Bemisia tabaci) TaxID=1163752 RepID=A0AAU8RPH3_9GAMM|nr:hypothetical protein O3E_01205 [Candidatus Portiera aleyrodidarum MED (Bemisia tabaci)]
MSIGYWLLAIVEQLIPNYRPYNCCISAHKIQIIGPADIAKPATKINNENIDKNCIKCNVRVYKIKLNNAIPIAIIVKQKYKMGFIPTLSTNIIATIVDKTLTKPTVKVLNNCGLVPVKP